jgi:hypothetical protein
MFCKKLCSDITIRLITIHFQSCILYSVTPCIYRISNFFLISSLHMEKYAYGSCRYVYRSDRRSHCWNTLLRNNYMGRHYCKNDLGLHYGNNDLVMWREEHFWNARVFQSVHLSNLVYLIYSLLNDVLSSSDYTASNDSIVN